MEKEIENLMFIGLPQSGKSTFIAALWHVIESEEIDISLKITSLPRYREYLHSIRSAWLSCEKLERNKGEFLSEIVLDIIDKSNGSNTQLYFPDVAGEMFESQFATRRLTKEYVDRLRLAGGVIIFVNPDVIKKPVLISSADELIEGNRTGEPANISKPWDYSDAPTQVILIDLLQMIFPYFKKHCKVTVVISAWDVIYNSLDHEYKKLTPELWLKKELPMISQFLKSNNSFLSFRVYGISAQGGAYDDGDKTTLHGFNKQSERIKVQLGDSVFNDITHPIKWLLDEK